jgi:hypothetical protein
MERTTCSGSQTVAPGPANKGRFRLTFGLLGCFGEAFSRGVEKVYSKYGLGICLMNIGFLSCREDTIFLITHVETMSGPAADGAATPKIHAALQQRG